MRGIRSYFILLSVIYVVVTGGFCLLQDNSAVKKFNENNVAVNRINHEIEQGFAQGGNPNDIIASEHARWSSTYGASCPDDIEYIPLQTDDATPFYAHTEKNTVICTIYLDGELRAMVRYSYDNTSNTMLMIAVIGTITLFYLFALVYGVYFYLNIIKPFRELSEYPERMARLQTKQKLPESKSRYFGKYIWGMNMLSNQLEINREHIAKHEYQRQTLLASIAHGVKTPVANIRLYAEAIIMGLYSDGGSESVSADIAKKIDKNAQKIEALVVEMLETSVTSLMDYEPEIEHFYLGELAGLIEKEFGDRLNIQRIPYTVECDSGYMASSDKWALFRVISQLLENAMKYGSGEGLSISMAAQDEGFCISVKNKGKLLPEKELPYIFKSYWRGSNAESKEGSGIGLYVASETVKRLGGTIQARRLEKTSEMEFVIYIE